ncbi:MAG: hypothetical protein K6G01_01465 [Eubacterium sp.]|nr:hypothetical protein [Eubacterium sp.]
MKRIMLVVVGGHFAGDGGCISAKMANCICICWLSYIWADYEGSEQKDLYQCLYIMFIYNSRGRKH